MKVIIVCVSSHFYLMHPQVHLPLAVYACNMPLSVGVSCDELDSPSNGLLNTSAGTFFGDVARYSCDRGYTLNGPAERTCQADGRWNGSVPTCDSEYTLFMCP